jgi:hypothetical protein
MSLDISMRCSDRSWLRTSREQSTQNGRAGQPASARPEQSSRWTGRWAYEQRDADDRLEFAGIRYLSRLSSDWECWALFEDVALDEQERGSMGGVGRARMPMKQGLA